MTYAAIDLFSETGAFSLGIKNAGIRVFAAIDCDKQAVVAHRKIQAPGMSGGN